MKDSDAITCMALSMFYGTYRYIQCTFMASTRKYILFSLYLIFVNRTSITVIELLAAVCLVKGGHIKIMEAVDNFKKENGEKHRFEKLVDFFMDPNASAEFQGACMNFINVIVHSAEDMNFRIHLQHEFTLLGLDDYLEVSLLCPVIVVASVCTQMKSNGHQSMWVIIPLLAVSIDSRALYCSLPCVYKIHRLTYLLLHEVICTLPEQHRLFRTSSSVCTLLK